MIRRPPRSTLSSSSAASDVYKRQLTHLGDITGSSVTDTSEDRALKSYRWGEPPLKGSTERDGGAGDAEDVRRYIVITAIEAPYPAIGIASLVVRSEEEAADHDIFERVILVDEGSEFKMEVVERT